MSVVSITTVTVLIFHHSVLLRRRVMGIRVPHVVMSKFIDITQEISVKYMHILVKFMI